MTNEFRHNIALGLSYDPFDNYLSESYDKLFYEAEEEGNSTGIFGRLKNAVNNLINRMRGFFAKLTSKKIRTAKVDASQYDKMKKQDGRLKNLLNKAREGVKNPKTMEKLMIAVTAIASASAIALVIGEKKYNAIQKSHTKVMANEVQKMEVHKKIRDDQIDIHNKIISDNREKIINVYKDVNQLVEESNSLQTDINDLESKMKGLKNEISKAQKNNKIDSVQQKQIKFSKLENKKKNKEDTLKNVKNEIEGKKFIIQSHEGKINRNQRAIEDDKERYNREYKNKPEEFKKVLDKNTPDEVNSLCYKFYIKVMSIFSNRIKSYQELCNITISDMEDINNNRPVQKGKPTFRVGE